MKASNAASASLLVSAIQISCSDRLAFGCWLFGNLLRTLAVLCTQQRCSRVVGHSSPSVSPIALEAVCRIDALFDIERRINGQDAGHRRAVRQELSAPLVAE